MSELASFVGKKVHVITTDARFFEGVLEGFDKNTNIILSNSIERIIYPAHESDETNEAIPSGVNILRGNEIVCIGEIDDVLHAKINWLEMKGSPLKTTKNPL
ncbi:lsm8 [Candida theae]|uniref:LSM2-LSM8 complex subunit LSM8 n=1 Tax=Candida theae TaxID=1198502 RepID=A0AAD5FWN3_9ASCO|nr:lsm8 [Candida theae]KAI5949091.1 lsm8 [Candida theae]